jgi:hypothetical protein
MSSPQYVKGIYSPDYWNNLSNLNRLVQEDLHQPVSSADPAIAPTSLLETGEESAQEGQCTSAFCPTRLRPGTAADWFDDSPGYGRHTP